MKQLLASWPRGTVMTSSWLAKQGIRFDLLDRYRRSGWVRSIGNGAVVQIGDPIDWQGAIYAIQYQLERSIHPGGKTALELHGLAHFLPIWKQTLVLFGSPNETLPAWFERYDWGTEIDFHTTNLFGDNPELGLEERKVKEFEYVISSPERAMLEVLYFLPKKQSFNEALLLMENLTTLRPALIQELLEICNSIKVRRLFLYLAEKCNHDWLNLLNPKDIDIGRGKRVIQKGGILDPKYLITVPADYKGEVIEG